MKNLFFVIFLLSAYRELHAQNTADIIKWQPDYRLAYSDFQKTPEKNTGAVAISSVDFVYSYAFSTIDTLKVVIENKFYRQLSWMLIRDSTVLNHEQTHFNIEELFARKFMRALQSLNFTLKTKDNSLRILYHSFYNESAKFHKTFDSGVHEDGALIKSKQREWNEKISSLLNQYPVKKTCVFIRRSDGVYEYLH